MLSKTMALRLFFIAFKWLYCIVQQCCEAKFAQPNGFIRARNTVHQVINVFMVVPVYSWEFSQFILSL